MPEENESSQDQDDGNVNAEAGRTTKATVADLGSEHADQAADSDKKSKKEKKDPFSFTDPGCRTEVRLGALLTVGPIFLWLWLRPDTAVWILVIGLPLLWGGIPVQAMQARKEQRPGYPWKLGIAFTLLGALMIPDQMSQVVPGGTTSLQIQAPALCLSGIWILAWWFYARAGDATQGEVVNG